MAYYSELAGPGSVWAIAIPFMNVSTFRVYQSSGLANLILIFFANCDNLYVAAIEKE